MVTEALTQHRERNQGEADDDDQRAKRTLRRQLFLQTAAESAEPPRAPHSLWLPRSLATQLSIVQVKLETIRLRVSGHDGARSSN